MKKVLLLFISLILLSLPMMLLASCTDGDTTDGENSHPDEENPQESSLTEDEVMERLEGMYVSDKLTEALLESGDSERFTIRVEIAFINESLLKELEYKGKKYSEYEAELYELYLLDYKLEELAYLNDGVYLAYGEIIYTEGAPDGVRWTEELYEQKLDYYGEELLSQYISDGIFLRDEALADYETNQEKISALCQVLKEAKKVAKEQDTQRALLAFAKEGYFVTLKDTDCFQMLITKKDFLRMTIDNITRYDFYLGVGVESINRELPD